MADPKETSERGPAGTGPEKRRVRGKPGTEAAKEVAREEQRSGADTRRASTPADPDEQTDHHGVEEESEEPFREHRAR